MKEGIDIKRKGAFLDTCDIVGLDWLRGLCNDGPLSLGFGVIEHVSRAVWSHFDRRCEGS